MGTIGFKTQAQREAEEKEMTSTNEVQGDEVTNTLEEVLTVHGETIDRMNATFDYICSDEFKTLDQNARARILSDYTYYSQVEAKLQ